MHAGHELTSYNYGYYREADHVVNIKNVRIDFISSHLRKIKPGFNVGDESTLNSNVFKLNLKS